MNTFLNIIASSIRMSIPLGYASIAGAISEFSGIVALGLEGFMTIGAFAGVLGAYYSGSAWIGVLTAAAAGALYALIFGVFCVRYQSNQVVAGVGMNIIAEGLVSVLMIGIFGSKGKSAMVASLPAIQIPVIKEIPVLNVLLSGYSGLAYLLAAVTVISWIVIYRMPIGIRLRATGINDRVVDSLGLRSNRIQYVSVMVCGGLSALGGAFLSLSQLNFYSKDMVAGRGYIALAIFVFAKKNPVYCVWISILFGLTETIQLRMQAFPIPTQFLSMIPYLCTLIMLLFAAKNFKTQRKEHV